MCDSFAVRMGKHELSYLLIYLHTYITQLCIHVSQDVLELLEKRVKSRFSHRQIHLCPKFSLEDYVAIFRMYLRLPDDIEADVSYISQWNSRVEVCIMMLVLI